MNTQELRIGNLVQAKGNVIQVTSINYDQLLKSVDVDEWYVSGEKLSDLEPIPLTPEWLERCGFERTSPEGWWTIQPNPYSQKMDLFCDGNSPFHYVDGAFSPDLKYVHQLQNLYFALTGTELTIKETVKA